MNPVLARRMQGMSGNVIREILKLTQQPNVISFAGGLPSPDSFPGAELEQIATRLMQQSSSQVLQYATTEGYEPLRQFIAAWVKERDIEASSDEVAILSGSQQGIDLACKAFLNPGDKVLIERPTYLAVLQILKLYEATPVHVHGDSEGMDPDALENAIRTERPKMIYLVPTFRNPSGETMSLARRQAIIEIASRHGVLVIEDDPYGELRYRGDRIPTLKALDSVGNVIYLGSFSKIVAPGLRVGYAVAPRPLLAPMIIAKQGTDVHTSNLSQQIVAEYCLSGQLPAHIQSIVSQYGAKRDAMLQAIGDYFPREASYVPPEGGLFLWVTLPERISTTALLEKAVAERVAFIPGTPFYADGGGTNAMRLNFSNASFDDIEAGIARLGEVIRREV